ncbi:MAG: Hsp20/alpha crystallin family protein [Nitrospina sp.]|jgi:HSP20 family molecular chaperone IbpA|nr:Hsp20/alpha crystallin family protein [Nitrospina sp.]MBT6600518.1 Hsp20/alpha crystallin family protein [Nitrospina sp.]
MNFTKLIPLQWDRYDTYGNDNYDETIFSLDKSMERFLSPVNTDYLGNNLFDFRKAEQSKFPKVDIAESANNFLITAELPGLDSKNVDLTLDDGTLTIKGEKKEVTINTQGEYYSRECSYGKFRRTFQIPEKIDQKKIDASFVNGVLTVTMPKISETKKEAKKILINQ